ncbi:hypothetical protein HMPREF0496_1061 [Lentilactobacillus hilgardii ATCC 27305]|nr:hypothetical protein HMPREF0496_1061 [Lentilactobacillus hilgardii ATCC 27305]
MMITQFHNLKFDKAKAGHPNSTSFFHAHFSRMIILIKNKASSI